MSNRDKLGTQVILDVTPVSLQCHDMGECPAIVTLREKMPSVNIETYPDGTIKATCPIRKYLEAQSLVNTTCFGCRQHG